MKQWTYVEPQSEDFPQDFPVFITKTEEEILKEYYPFWSERLVDAGRDLSNYSQQDCIETWSVVYGAWEGGPEDEK